MKRRSLSIAAALRYDGRVVTASISQNEKNGGNPYRVEALARGLNILDLFDDDEAGWLSLSEIARRAGLSVATALRLVRTLQESGFLLQSPTSKLYGTARPAMSTPGPLDGGTKRAAAAPGALDVLDVFTEDQPDWSLPDLAQRYGLDDATMQGLLDPLVERDYLERDPQTGLFRVGLRPVALGYLSLTRLPVRTHALPVLSDLLQSTGLDTTLALRLGNAAIYVVRLNAPEVWKGHTGVGRIVPLHATAVGKLMLAFLEPDEVERILAETGLPRYTETTIADRRVLDEQLGEARVTGVAVDNAEWMPGRGCVAAAVRNATGQVIAAVGASGDPTRIQSERDSLSHKVSDAANRLSYSLGYLRAYF